MDNVKDFVYLILLAVLFAGAVGWAFGRKRKKRFEDDAIFRSANSSRPSDPP